MSEAKDQYQRFPPDEWGAEQLGYLTAPTRLLTQGWWRLTHLPSPPPDSAAECEAVRVASEQRDSHKCQIRAEDGEWPVITRPLMEKLGDPVDGNHYPATWELLHTALDDLQCGLYQWKRHFSRARPYQVCGARLIDPMTPKPPHPSYPGGHAAQTHTLALLLAQLRPSASVDLLKRAAEISENRVIAGWHYPSDNAAGVLLAQQFVDLLLHNGDAVDMLEAARAEWPLT